MTFVDAMIDWCDEAVLDPAWSDLQGAMTAAGVTLAEQFADDVSVLRAAGPAATVASVGESNFVAMPMLPARFQGSYDEDFAVRWAVTVRDISERLAGAWRPSGSLAEALACLLIFDQAEMELEIRQLLGPVEWREIAEEIVIPDTDVSLLLDPALDGVDDSDVGRLLRLPSFRAADWFDPSGAAAG